MPTCTKLIADLESCSQLHLVEYLSKVTPQTAHDALCEQLEAIDYDELGSLLEQYIRNYTAPPSPGKIEPAAYFSLDGQWDRDEFRSKGEALIRASKVACFTVAGGQGSRLGYDGPKGCYPTSCVTQKPLFQIFAEGIQATAKKYHAKIPWYIMTSPLNHEQTIAFFERHAYFGLAKDEVMFFEQGVMPSLDAQSGEILMADPLHIATNPDGHGGAFKALDVSGALADMKSRGIEHMSYFQIDNPHAMVIDPLFVGLHACSEESSGEFSSKMVAKAAWDEKVGVFCDVDGSIEVIEYSDLDEKLAKQTTESGRLAFNAGSVAIHMIGVAYIEKLVRNAEYALPFHRALKKVAHFDLATGQVVTPDANNTVKLEKFVFDGIPLADKSIVMETDRVEEFAPVKNATGSDSIVSSQQIQTQRAARWLEAVGVKIPYASDGCVDATIEISPMTAICSADLKAIDLPESIEAGSTVTL